MKILVIGGAGYLGLKLSKRLLLDRFHVTICDNMNYDTYDVIDKLSDKFNIYNGLEQDHFEFIEDDILNLKNNVNNLENYDKIFYLASPRLQDINDDKTVLEEVDRFSKVIEMFRDTIDNENSGKHFYFMSSCSVYGKTTEAVNEYTEPMVTSHYSKLKIECEKLMLKENNSFKIFRLSTLYGRGDFQRNDILINNLIGDIKEGKSVEIWDPEAHRPHLHIDDACELLFGLINTPYKDKILNLGFDELNITKRELVGEIEKVIESKVDADFQVVNDSRDYSVSFARIKKLNPNLIPKSYYTGIWDLYVGDINITLEDYDSILDFNRPATSSKTWYLEEEGKISIPKLWGEWNVLHGDPKKFMTKETFKGMVAPINKRENVKLYDRKTIKNNKHLYLIPIYNPAYFELNKDIGFKCVSKKFIRDVKENRARIVFYHTLEGYSGGDKNNDLEIIKKWCDESKIKEESVYYISGNLKISDSAKEKGLKINCIGESAFDIWLNPQFRPDDVIPYHPHESMNLYLSYNRNMGRAHRIGICSKLFEYDLLKRGMISIGEFDLKEGDSRIYTNLKELSSITPLTIDRTLDVNWANDISISDFSHTFVSLVTETLADEKILFLSEKIWKPIYLGHPFLLIGNPHTLKYLKKLGFKTFDKWWNEDYDNDTDVNVRIQKVADILALLENKSIDELKELRNEMIEVCRYNQQHFNNKVDLRYKLSAGDYNPQHSVIKILANIFYDIK
jgi:nucleoside-diphosphate-sugar epimerase